MNVIFSKDKDAPMLQDHVAAINSGNSASDYVSSCPIINLSNEDFEDVAFNLTRDRAWLQGRRYIMIKSPKQSFVAMVEDSHIAYAGFAA